jgi:hypothetical protein
MKIGLKIKTVGRSRGSCDRAATISAMGGEGGRVQEEGIAEEAAARANEQEAAGAQPHAGPPRAEQLRCIGRPREGGSHSQQTVAIRTRPHHRPKVTRTDGKTMPIGYS